MKIRLLKNYKGQKEGAIISIDDTLAKTLINNGIARLATDRDVLVKPEYSNTALASPKDKMMRSKKIN